MSLPPPFGSPDHPILLLGASGMLGRAWAKLLTQNGLHFQAPGSGEVNFRLPMQVASAVQPNHALVINCAAYTDVDRAEAEPEIAHGINAESVGTLARSCAARGIPLVHYSTDYVFSGTGETGKDGPRPWKTEAPRAPLNAYGRSKAVGEEAIEKSGADFLLIRTSWLYAPWGKNFVRTMAGLMRSDKPLKVVDDQTGRPTSAEHLAAASLVLLQKNARGIFHVTDGGACTWYTFACAIARGLGLSPAITPCTSAEYPRPARRPAWSVLDLEKTENLIGPMPPWQNNLARVLDHLEN